MVASATLMDAVAVRRAVRRITALRHADPVTFAGMSGVAPDPWQADLLSSTAARILLNCSRQSGKSLMAALIGVRTALVEDGSLILLLSPTQRQSGELFKKCLTVYRELGRPVPGDSETALTVTLGNGSRIVSLPGKEGTVRGYSGVDLLVIDESAFVPNDLYVSVRPMLAVSEGRLVALSTPHGTRGWWYEAWRSTEPWERYEVPATECPRISPAFLAEEKRELGEWWFKQEYLCEFLDAQSAAFTRADIDRAFSEEITTWQL